jgi:hypothetical protein
LWEENPIREEWEGDPYDYVLSANIHRRHLTPEKRRDLIAAVIKAKPESSNRVIAKMIKADHKTVGTIRDKLEGTGEVSPVERRVGADKKVRKQPVKTAAKPSKVAVEINSPDCAGTGIVMTGAGAATDVIPAAETNPIVAAWDKAGPRKRHDFVLARKLQIMWAQQQIGQGAFTDTPPTNPAAWIKKETVAAPSAPAVGADGLDIPDYLKRAPKDATAS